MTEYAKSRRLPHWLKTKMPGSGEYLRVKRITKDNNLHTICASGNCPNIADCWDRGTATFMILGNICTRACRFCGVQHGKPLPTDNDEPLRVAESVKMMGLKHCVITSVDRDDLPDFGSSLWAETIRVIKNHNKGITIEALIPDFMGNTTHLDTLASATPDIISHNIETVERLTPEIRSVAGYSRSLSVLKYLHKQNVVVKSGFMIGLGETEKEILSTMEDIQNTGCSILTIGQYLQPTLSNHPVMKFYEPDFFEQLKEKGLKLGFRYVESSPLTRSSYHAEKQVVSHKT